MSRIILSTIVLFAFTLVGKSQTPYTLTATDVTIVNGIIISSTLTNASGDNYQPDIIIPEMLDGQVVTGIGEKAFHDNCLISVTLPAGLTSIGDFAFAVNNLTSVTLPAGVTSIGESAYRANLLIRVDLPAGLTSIGEDAFSMNSDLASFVLPKVSTVGNSTRWQESSGTVLDAGHVILPANFGNSYRAIILD